MTFQILENVQIAQERYTKESARRQTKGVKVFDFKTCKEVDKRGQGVRLQSRRHGAEKK